MKRCLKCRAVYDDEQEFCPNDGAPLLDYAKLDPREGSAKFRGGRVVLVVTAGVVAVVILFFAAYLLLGGRRAPEAATRPADRQTAEASPARKDQGVEMLPASSAAPRPADKPGYLLIGLSSRDRAAASAEMERRNRDGYQTHVRHSDEWPGLSAGWYVLVYGAYETAEEAARAAGELKARGVEVYVKHSGAAKTDGAAPGPEPEAANAGAAAVAAETPGAVETAHEAAVRRYGADEAAAIGEVEQVWDRHFTRCGDSYFSVDSYGVLRQVKGVTFVPRSVTFLLRTRGGRAAGGDEVEWSGTVQARWSVWRRALRQGAAWEWGEWKDTPQERSFAVSKVNSRWKVLDVLYDQKRIECSEVPS